MKIDFKMIVPIVLSLIVFFVLCQFRTVPVSQFWKGYRILYVYTEELSESDILTILEQNGCASVISYGKQRLPVLSTLAPVQMQSDDSYLYRRNDFFTDKLHRALVFYIPDSQGVFLEKSIRQLSAFQGTVAGSDGKSSFPWVAPLLASLFFLLLFYFSRNKVLFTCGAAFFVLFAFCRPLYTVAASVCLFLFSFFLFHKFWRRKDFIKIALNSPYVLLFAFAPLLALFFSSPLLSFFYCISFLGSLSLVFLYHVVEEKKEKSYSFQPVFIRSARMMPVVGHTGIRLLGFLFAFLFALFLLFVFVGNVGGGSERSSMPSLPSPVSKTDAELVSLKDFVAWSWNTVTFPYRKIGENTPSDPKEGEVVSITDYVEENGKIVSVTNPAYIFNSEFKDGVYKSIDRLDYPALEKLMLAQGKNASFGYAKSASVSSSERFGSLMLLILLSLPFAAGLFYILGRKRYGLSV